MLLLVCLLPVSSVIYSLLPCHSLPGYGFFNNIRSNYLSLKQLECPPVQYRLPKSSKNYIYNDGNQPIPSIPILEHHRVHKLSNFIILYKKDQNSEDMLIWLHKNRFKKRFCTFHMHFPQMLGDNHDTHICLFEKTRKLQQF